MNPELYSQPSSGGRSNVYQKSNLRNQGILGPRDQYTRGQGR